MARPDWMTYGMGIAHMAATRSEDPYVKIGAVAMRADFSVAGVGYNGAPSGVVINYESRDARRDMMIHAEVNALRYAIAAEMAGGTILTTGTPCPSCIAIAAAHGVTRIFYGGTLRNYPVERSLEVAWTVGITLEPLYVDVERLLGDNQGEDNG